MAISVNEAIEKITQLPTNLKYEIIPIEYAENRICAKNIIAKICLPRFNNSAMDGYGILFEDKNEELEVVDTIFAGDNNDLILKKNQAVKIMTGARVPENCSAIIPKEDCEYLANEKIKVPNDIREFQHIRFIGEDINEGEILINIGEEINFARITLLASQGISHIKVFKQPKVVVFASGEELKLHYNRAAEYQIYNSNTPTFMSRCKELGAHVNFIGQARDTIDSIKELIENSLDADLIITSGGVSVGDADFTKEKYHNFIFAKMGEDLKNKAGRITVIPGYFDGQYFKAEQKRSPGMVSTLRLCNSILVLDKNVSLLKKEAEVKVLPINWKFFEENSKDFLTNE